MESGGLLAHKTLRMVLGSGLVVANALRMDRQATSNIFSPFLAGPGWKEEDGSRQTEGMRRTFDSITLIMETMPVVRPSNG